MSKAVGVIATLPAFDIAVSPVVGVERLRRVDHHLECGAFIHCGVALRGLFELHVLVEDEARVHGFVKHSGQQLLDVGTGGGHTAGEGDGFAEEAAASDQGFFVLGNANTADHSTSTNNAEGL